jgi:CRISPR-associated exonuclease Cas4
LLLAVALVLLVLGTGLWWAAGRRQAATGLPRAEVLAQDTERGELPTEALVSHRHRLAGRPDYLLRVGGATVPVEVKPRRRAAAPYSGDLLQLAAYCLLVEETTGVAPPYGILRYAHCSWRLPYDAAARDGVLAALSALGRDARAADVARSHEEPRRCAACAVRAACDQRLR